MDKLSYAWGLAMGQQLKGMGVATLEFDSFVNGLKSVYGEGKSEMEPEEAHKLINEYLQSLQEKMVFTCSQNLCLPSANQIPLVR